MNNIKVSVVIPICNVGKYLNNTLMSVTNQTLKNIEIICVDDFSTDNCREIIEKFKEKDNRIITIYHEKNLSTSQARKNGVLASRGQYIMFLDGDDELYPNACETAYNAINKNQIDVVHFGTEVVNCRNMPEQRIAMNQRLMNPYINHLQSINLIKKCWDEKKFGFQIWNKIYNGELVRKAFKDVEDGNYPKAQDLYAFFVIAYYAKSYLGIETKLYKYNFGLGVTGGNFISLEKYNVLLKEKLVSDALVRFIEAKKLSNEYKLIVENIEHNFLSECVTRWKDNLEYEYKDAGFQNLCNTFGFDKVMTNLFSRFWDQKLQVGEIVKEISCFNYCKRPPTKKKTIAAYYRSISNGGAQRVVAMLCNRWSEMLNEDGEYLYNVVLITDDGPCENEYSLNSRVKRAFLPSFGSSIKENYKKRYEAWKEIIHDNDIDIVISSQWVAPCTFWDMLAVKGQPSHPAFLIHSHNSCAVPFSFIANDAMELTIKYRICDGIIALSECDELYIKSFNENVKYIVNPIAFNPEDINVSSYDENNIVWCGRIANEKKPLDSIKAMQYIVKEFPNIKLHIVGDGNEKIIESMKKEAFNLGIENNICFEGFTLDVGKYYGKASIMLVTSEYEGFPLTIGEALAYGLPVVCYDMPYLTYMRDGRGIVAVPQGRYDILAKEIITLLKNSEKIRRIGLEGKKHITEICKADIETDWSCFFEKINEQKNNLNLDINSIVLRQISEFQYKGRCKIIAHWTQSNRKLKFERDNAFKQKQQLLGLLDKERKDKDILEKKIKETEKHLNDVKSGLSFKIGRILTWLPRKILGKK